ncbi:MAG: GAF domain-containing protein, partial [Deltaproteobacteria bacterium]|jgi:signal transduction histidine kinase|nr:GAF domain-containing protein [Deltaproteobacteria bacterium]
VALALKRESPYAGFMQNDPKAPELTAKEQLNTICSVPLTFQGPHQGNISLFNKMGGHRGGLAVNPQPFDREDMELLQAMNSIISGVVENAVTFKKVESLYSSNEEMVRYLSNLYDISSAMLTTVRYDELVWIIIKALTLKQGLGFDKVLILLNEGTEEEPVLVSSAFWATAQVEDSEELREPLVEVLRRPSRAEASKMVDSGLKIALSIPVTADSNRILARVITEKKPLLGFRGIDAYDDLDLGDFGSRAYAAVPMLAKGREVGVIAVDRSVSGEPLTASSLRDLTMLANQAGLAIENTRLYDEIRQSNVTLTQVRNRLIEAEKLAAQGEMGTQLAHEIRNPLVSIGGFTQRVLKKMDPEDPLRKYVVVILEEVERLNGVLNNVLDFSRDEQGLIRKFYLQDVAEEAIKSLKHEMERTNTLVKTDYEADLPKVLADDRQVMHVFLNLIANASQAMAPNGGTVYVKIYQYKENETLYAACQITDTGPGIAEQLLPNIFNPFFTTKTKGTGLGLSIVKKIIERYNGQIACANRPEGYSDGGASFTFMFPAAT